jgi:hypothetical protein
VCVWYEENIAGVDNSDGRYLYALKATQPGDRQLVIEGGDSDLGPIAVVDFGTPAVWALGRYHAFGSVTMLRPPVTRAMIASNRVLREYFFAPQRFRGGPKRLTDPHVLNELGRLAGGWPPHTLPTGDPTPTRDSFGRWSGAINIDPEAVFKNEILTDARLRRSLGFSDAVRGEVYIPAGRTDLYDGTLRVVGELKRILRAGDVKQLEDYLDDLLVLDPHWRGLFIHGHRLSPRVEARLDARPHSARIEVWALEERASGRLRAISER